MLADIYLAGIVRDEGSTVDLKVESQKEEWKGKGLERIQIQAKVKVKHCRIRESARA